MRTLRCTLLFLVVFCAVDALGQLKVPERAKPGELLFPTSAPRVGIGPEYPTAITFGYDRDELLKLFNELCWQDRCVPMADVLDFLEAKGTP